MQTIESKNSNILNRFENNEPTGKMTSFRISLDGKNMSYLSRIFTTQNQVVREMTQRFPGRELKFIE